MAASDAVLRRLKAADITPKKLAEALGVDRSTASLMLSGKRGIPIWHLDALAELLKATPGQLVTDPDLLRHAPEGHSGTQRGSDVPAAAQARIAELEQERDHREALIRAMRNVEVQLANALAEHGQSVRAEDADARKTKPASRGRPRKAG